MADIRVVTERARKRLVALVLDGPRRGPDVVSYHTVFHHNVVHPAKGRAADAVVSRENRHAVDVNVASRNLKNWKYTQGTASA